MKLIEIESNTGVFIDTTKIETIKIVTKDTKTWLVFGLSNKPEPYFYGVLDKAHGITLIASLNERS